MPRTAITRAPHARHVVPLPDELDPVTAAPLTDAGLTSYHAIRRSAAKITPSSTTVVLGIGGLGHVAVQILKATSATKVIAVDTREEARDLALDCGADLALAPSGDLVAQIRDETSGHGADAVLDFVGSDDSLAVSAGVVRQLGDLTIVGLGGGTLPVSFFGIPYEASVQTTYWGNREELVDVLGLAARGLLRVETTLYTLEQAVTAYEDLRNGVVRGRAVVVPTDSYRS
jgi:propanol-preferring alcohol dehydrogenase